MGHPQRQFPVYSKKCRGCIKTNHFREVYRLMLRQQEGQKPPGSDRSIHDIRQDQEAQPVQSELCDRRFDLVKIKYHKFDSVKFMIFTKLESGTSQKRHA